MSTYQPKTGDRVRVIVDQSADDGAYSISKGDLGTVTEVVDGPTELYAMLFGGTPIFVEVDDKPLPDSASDTAWALTSSEVEAA